MAAGIYHRPVANVIKHVGRGPTLALLASGHCLQLTLCLHKGIARRGGNIFSRHVRVRPIQHLASSLLRRHLGVFGVGSGEGLLGGQKVPPQITGFRFPGNFHFPHPKGLDFAFSKNRDKIRFGNSGLTDFGTILHIRRTICWSPI